MPESGSFMIGDRKQNKNNLVELEASLAPAEAEVGLWLRLAKKRLTQVQDDIQ